MGRPRFVLGYLFVTFALTSAARAGDTPDPLRLIPDQADFFVKIERPLAIFETIEHHPLLKELEQFDTVRELFDSTNSRRFSQLLAHLKMQLGLDAPTLLDKIAGGGAVLAGKFGDGNQPAALVVQGKDPSLMRRFLALAQEIIQQELNRQDAKTTIQHSMFQKYETWQIGPDFHAALIDAALVISNKREAIEKIIALHLEGDAKSMLRLPAAVDARRLVAPDPLAWVYASLAPAKKSPMAKDLFKLPRNDANLTVLFGAILDVVGRSDYVAAGVYLQQGKSTLSIRIPRGRDGMSEGLAFHVPAAGDPGSLPLLEPKGVLYSTSFYLDLSASWELRSKLFNAAQVKGFEEFDKTSAKFLSGATASKLFKQAGPYLRVVAAHPEKMSKYAAGQYIPAFAVVSNLREPENFSKRIDAILRSAAVLASTQFKLKNFEETRGNYKIVGYRFVEDTKATADPQGLRFNYVPCYVTVRNQFVVSSTLEFCREMVDLLDRETADPDRRGQAETAVSRFYLGNATALLDSYKDLVVAQAILNQAIPPEKAKDQLKMLSELVQRLGVLELATTYGAQDFRYDFLWRLQPQQLVLPVSVGK